MKQLLKIETKILKKNIKYIFFNSGAKTLYYLNLF